MEFTHKKENAADILLMDVYIKYFGYFGYFGSSFWKQIFSVYVSISRGIVCLGKIFLTFFLARHY